MRDSKYRDYWTKGAGSEPPNWPKPVRCLCCGEPVLLQCETEYCGSRCRRVKCGHAWPAAIHRGER